MATDRTNGRLPAQAGSTNGKTERKLNWLSSFGAYGDKRVVMVLLMGFSSGLPLYLTYATLTAWLATAGVNRRSIGLFALVATPYAFKYAWSPLIDRLPAPIPIGRRRGWGLTIQIALAAAIFAMSLSDPRHHLSRMAATAVLVAFLSATQDIVIDAWRIEILPLELQGPGAGAIQAGYRMGMLVASAGALFIAGRYSWFAAYATMSALMIVGILTFIFGPEPVGSAAALAHGTLRGFAAVSHWFKTAVIDPFADFMHRPLWPAILLFVFAYKLGAAMSAYMANPFYIYLGYSLGEIAAISKLMGTVAIIAGMLVGGVVTARFGILRSVVLCGALQAVGILFYCLQAVEGHTRLYLALAVIAENFTDAMAGAALVSYLSTLCNSAFTATQYALLSSLAAVGRSVVTSTTGALSSRLGWFDFFALTAVICVPALLLAVWIGRRSPILETQPLAEAASTPS